MHYSLQPEMSKAMLMFIFYKCTENSLLGSRNPTAPGQRVPTPTPPSSTRGKAGRNQLKEEITPLLPTGKAERFSQTISNLGHAALLRQCEFPL